MHALIYTREDLLKINISRDNHFAIAELKHAKLNYDLTSREYKQLKYYFMFF